MATVTLQSGFIVEHDDDYLLTKPAKDKDHKSKVVSLQINDVTLKAPNKLYYSPQITQLYTEYLTNPKLVRDFDFRENVISYFKVYFKDYIKNLCVWANNQIKSPHISSSHILYLKESIDLFEKIDFMAYMDQDELFTREKITRSLNLQTAARLIEIKSFSSVYNNESEMNKVVNKIQALYKQRDFINSNVENSKLKDDFVDWLIVNIMLLKNGTEELLTFLFIIFGKKENI